MKEQAHSSGLLARASADVLSDALRVVRLNGALFFLTDASVPWSIAVPGSSSLTPVLYPRSQHLISYHVVTSGSCWCHSPGAAALLLQEGDVVVIPHGDPYRLSQPVDHPNEWPERQVVDFFRGMASGEHPFVVQEGGGGAVGVKVLCGFLGCDLRPFNPVLAALPQLLHVPRGSTSSGDHLRHLIEFTMAESRTRDAGTECVRLRLAELMFVEVVRRYLAEMRPDQRGWLAGLCDPVVGRALGLIHSYPERPWTLPRLAREVNQSRSVLAERFTRFVGTPPIQYLARWRIQRAARMLTDGNDKIAVVAAAVGYESLTAFTRAFVRMTGASPGQWRRTARGSAVVRGQTALEV